MLSLVAASTLLAQAPDDGLKVDSPFKQRGYYITFMRMPTYDLSDWRRIVDGIHDDGGNTLLLWVGGAFRSEKFPITWRYNAEHENVRRDFVRALIDHAHTRGIKVLLGFTPFGYDGVNQYPLEHPELRAVGKDGKPAPPVSPERVRAMKDRGELTPTKRAEYRAALERVRGIERRHREPTSHGEIELHRIAGWVLDRWGDEERRLLDPPDEKEPN